MESIFSQRNLYLGGILLAVGLTVSIVNTLLRDPLSHIPGPWYTKWTDWVSVYHALTGSKPLYIHKLHEKYGPVVRVNTTEVDFQDPRDAQQIFSVKREFPKSPIYRHITPRVTNVFSTTDIQVHRRHRKLLSSPLSESGLKRFMPQIESKIRLAIQRMREEAETRGAADVLKWWLFMTTDVIGELSFGDSFRMLEHCEENDYFRALKSVAFVGGIRVSFPNIVSFAFDWAPFLPIVGKVVRVTTDMRKYGTQSLQRHRDYVENEGEDAKPTLLSKLYKAGDEEALTFEEIRDNAMAYIVAGSDTTSNTLTYLVWAVCRHPDIQRRLVAEVQTLRDDFTLEDIKQLPYLEQVIQEAMRLYAAVPATLPRVVPAGGAELGGYALPQGSTVGVTPYCLHHNTEVFPDPDSFNPSRWDAPTKAMKDSFVTFGGGSRVCLGLHLAYIEVRLGIAHFFRAFPNARVSTKENFSEKDMKAAMFFLMAPKGQRCMLELS